MLYIKKKGLRQSFLYVPSRLSCFFVVIVNFAIFSSGLAPANSRFVFYFNLHCIIQQVNIASQGTSLQYCIPSPYLLHNAKYRHDITHILSQHFLQAPSAGAGMGMEVEIPGSGFTISSFPASRKL